MPVQSEPSFCAKIQSIHNSLAQVEAESQLKGCDCFEKLGGLCGEVKMILEALEETKAKESGEEERTREKRVLDLEHNSADTDDESVEISGNPMLNDVVLGNLFRVCEFGDLRRFRLVSKRWFNLSLPRWRTTAVVNIVSNQKHEEFSGRHARNYLSLSSSVLNLHDIPEASAQPYRNFKLHDFEFPELEDECGSPEGECDGCEWKWDLEPFWSSIGVWMHSLMLCEPKIEDGKLLRDIIVDKTPNLQSLKITNDRGPLEFFGPRGIPTGYLPFENDDDKVHSKLEYLSIDYDAPTIPWNPLFKCFPNLKIIDCQPCVGQVRTFLDAINHLNVIKKDQLLDLRFVRLISKTYNRSKRWDRGVHPEADSMVEQLSSSKRLRFRDVLFILDKHIGETVVSDLVKSHSSTLQKLLFSRGPGSGSELIHNITFNHMPLTSLTKLAINSRGIVPNLHFLECTPNLRVLQFNDLDLLDLVRATDRARMEGVQLEKLEEITFTGSSSELQESDLGLMAALARNVKVFEGPLDNIGFWTLCRCWPQMRKLIVHSPRAQFDDFGLTGKLAVADGSRMPNITSLKFLQEFRTDSPFLSDDSIRNGFMQLEYLRRLRVTLSASTSDEAYLELWNRFRSIHVSRDEKRMPLERRLNDELKRQAEFLARDYAIY